MVSFPVAMSARLEPSRGVAFREIQGQVAIVHVAEARLITLNALGSRIWSILDGSRPLHEVVDLVAQDVPGVERSQIEQDVVSFVSTLLDRALLEVRQ